MSESLAKEQSSLRTSIQGIEQILNQLQESEEFFALAIEEQDTEMFDEIDLQLDVVGNVFARLGTSKNVLKRT